MTTRRLHLQIHCAGRWHDAATLVIDDDALGIGSATTLDYDTGYFIEHGSEDFARERPAIDARALSVRHPVDLAGARLKTWPPFLLDLLPQGHARRRLAAELGHDEDDKALVYPLLIRGAGSPIGNIRVEEAWKAERQRIEDHTVEGVATDEIFERSPAFRYMADRFALIASGSSGVQGEWPKILLTRADDGLWYPDPVIEDGRAREHAIVKMSRARFEEDRLILAAEAPYLEVAREIGVRVASPLAYRNDTLIVPRFDRRAVDGKVVRSGQESLVSAAGVAAFGFLTSHERYLKTIHKVCSDPGTEVVEYVLRDTLARAMGDTDNHGRNTALQKHPDGRIALAPLFDFAPMTFDPGVIAPSTTWACLRGKGVALDYRLIAEAAGEATGDADIPNRLLAALSARADTVERLPDIARRQGVSETVIERACRFAEETAQAMRAGGAP